MSLYEILLVMTLSHSLVNCDDLCSALKPNGQYKGVKIYLRFENGKDSLWMTNRNGIEWKIHFTEDGDITANDTSIRNVSPTNLIDRITFVDVILGESLTIECDVTVTQPEHHKRVNCTNGQSVDVNDNSVFVGRYQMNDENLTYYLEVNKDNRKQWFVIGFTGNPSSPEIYRKDCNEQNLTDDQMCKRSQFIDDINDQRFSRLDSVVLISNKTKILFFNIDDRLKYCVLTKDVTEVRHQLIIGSPVS